MRTRRFLLTRTALGAAGFLLLANLVAGALGMRWLTPYVQPDFMVFYAYQQAGEPADAVFMGSSHTQAGILPDEVEAVLEEVLGRKTRVWNLSFRAGTGLGAPWLLADVFQEDLWPRVLVLEGDPLFWNAHLFTYTVWATQYWRHLAPPGEALRRLGEVPFGQTAAAVRRGIWGTEALLQLPFLFTRRPASKLRKYREHRGAMWEPEQVAAAREGEAFRSYVLDQEKADPVLKAALVNPDLSEERSLAMLRQAAALCREHGTELVLVNHPVLEPIMALNQPGAYEAWLDRMKAACARMEVEFLDLNLPENRLEERFVDHDHLGPLGALWWSRKLAREVVAPRLADEG